MAKSTRSTSRMAKTMCRLSVMLRAVRMLLKQLLLMSLLTNTTMLTKLPTRPSPPNANQNEWR